MNNVTLVGRLTKNPDYRVDPQDNEKTVARFTLAVDRHMKDKSADFITITCFRKTADLVNQYLTKGSLVGIEGQIRTGHYEKDGETIYTTDVIANRVEFLAKPQEKKEETVKPADDDIPTGFRQIEDDDIPF